MLIKKSGRVTFHLGDGVPYNRDHLRAVRVRYLTNTSRDVFIHRNRDLVMMRYREDHINAYIFTFSYFDKFPLAIQCITTTIDLTDDFNKSTSSAGEFLATLQGRVLLLEWGERKGISTKCMHEISVYLIIVNMRLSDIKETIKELEEEIRIMN